jgi:hypothetical protein
MVQLDSRVYMFTVTASAVKTMKCCVIHVQNCQGPVTVGYNQMASVAFGGPLIHELPILFYVPSHTVFVARGLTLGFYSPQ